MSTKKKTTENSTTTVTPNNPEWVTSGAQGLGSQILGLGARNPYDFVAPASALQSQAFKAVEGLRGAVPGLFGSAMQMASAGGNAGPFTAGAQGYAPSQAVAAQTYAPERVSAAGIAPVAYAPAASARGGIDSYMNPYEDAVVTSTLGDMNRARQMALADNGRSAVLAGQYGGSRQGVAEALTNGEFLRGVGSTVGALRQGGFGTALQYANADADRLQQANLFNAGAVNARAESQAQLEQQANLFNAGAANERGLTQAQLDQQTMLANQAATNAAGQFNSQLSGEMARFNAGQGDAAAARQLQAAGVLGGLGQYGLDALGQLGGTQQALDAAYRRAPTDLLQATTGMYGQLPLNLFNGQTTTGNRTSTETTSGLGNALSVAGGLAGNLGFSPLSLLKVPPFGPFA